MSLLHTVKMPDIGEGIVEVELVAWRVQPGDTVKEDQILADVMTDKAAVEIPSPVDGVVRSLGGAAGTALRVGAALISIEMAAGGGTAEDPGAGQERAPERPPAPPAADIGEPASERPIASPSVRRRAWELGIDLAAVRPSGPGGRIMQADLDAHPATARPAADTKAHGHKDDASETVPLSALRRQIAQKVQEATRRIPHFSYVEEVDVSELEALRAALNARHGEQRGRLTLLPLLARALCRTLPDFPQLNARFDDEAGLLTRYRAVHLGVATQTQAGLMVPVLRHAEKLDLWACAAEIRRLAEAARAGRATRAELGGSTITISSLGPLGGLVTTPVINHPEVAIVGVNRIVERPVLRQGQVLARLLMNLSSSFDHRIVDGQAAAEFVQALRTLLETPALLFVD